MVAVGRGRHTGRGTDQALMFTLHPYMEVLMDEEIAAQELEKEAEEDEDEDNDTEEEEADGDA